MKMLILGLIIGLVLSTLGTWRFVSASAPLGDVNGDGAVNALDAFLILQYNARLIESLPKPATATAISTPTATATSTASETPTATATHSPTNTPTDTATATGTNTPTVLATEMPTTTATNTPPPTGTPQPQPSSEFVRGLMEGCYWALIDWVPRISTPEAWDFCVEEKGDPEFVDAAFNVAALYLPSTEIGYETGWCMGYTIMKFVVQGLEAEDIAAMVLIVCLV